MRNLRPPHAPVTASFPVSFTIRCSHAPRKKVLAISGCIQTDTQTDRQTDTYPPCGDRGDCNNGFVSSINIIPEMYVSFPLPYPSSPASWTLLLPLSVQDSQNISSNDRYHHFDLLIKKSHKQIIPHGILFAFQTKFLQIMYTYKSHVNNFNFITQKPFQVALTK